ncbi:hypothetical protein [Roseateles sp. BYS96W]|uniref:Uncharacterized protein n=1 Tax=Pelomonas nitida TaxID=3299027 RepID=A0ABW7G1R0_9BURK
MDKIITNFNQLKADPKGWFLALPLWRQILLGVAATGLTLTALSSIFDAGALSCNDRSTKSQVLEIIDSHLETARWYQEAKDKGIVGTRKISEVRTTRSDKDLDRYACAAKYTFDIKGRTREVDFTYDVDYLEDEQKSHVLVDVNTVKSRYMTALMGF